MNLSLLPTEQHRADLLDLDLRPTIEQVDLMLAEHQHAVAAVQAAGPAIAAALDAITERLDAGLGRLIYVGAGTAGRLGLLDASEVPPTFDSERVLAVMAGGDEAMSSAREGAEDDPAAGERDIARLEVDHEDVVVGIAASGRTPYTIAAVRHARAAGALTIGLSSNVDAPLSREVDHAIEVATGPELIAGSTRLKAGTAQKVVLNSLSTLVMVKLGRTFGNLMVDVRSSNDKLRDRAQRMVAAATGVSEAESAKALDAAGGDHKVAIVALACGIDPAAARVRLDEAGGRIRLALDANRPEGS